jgi:energy-coupling factor transport system permease protein
VRELTQHQSILLGYFLTLFIFSLLSNHPLLLFLLLLQLLGFAKVTGKLSEIKAFLRFGLLMAAGIALLNPILSRAGQTIILYGPYTPVLGKLDISLEAVLYGLNMGLKLILMLSCFSLQNTMVDHDETFSAASKIMDKSVLVVHMATRMVPKMMRKARDITEVMTARGVQINSGSRLKRVKNYLLMFKLLILLSLEDSWQIAEAMQARAYGSGPRSRYRKYQYDTREKGIIFSFLCLITIGLIGCFYNLNSYDFYPGLTAIFKNELQAVYITLILSCTFLYTVFFARGIRSWQLSR